MRRERKGLETEGREEDLERGVREDKVKIIENKEELEKDSNREGVKDSDKEKAKKPCKK